MRHIVTLLAPVAPFRSGIARHSEAVARALAARDDVDLQVESFARLYPRWLYPGKSDREPGNGGSLPFAVRESIDTLNPFSWHMVANRIAARGGIVIISAWTFFVAPALATISRRLQRNGVKVITIVHNAVDHGASRWKSRLSNWQLRASDGFVTHSKHVTEQLREAGHHQPVRCVAHPSYCDFPPPAGSLPREYALELLCFGLVRRYKGVDVALRALDLADLENVRLTIAGEIWEDRATIRKLVNRLENKAAIEVLDRYVSDQEAAEFFARCDAVLAPYRSVTGSGVAAVAKHYRRPLIASDIAGLREHVSHGQTGWLFDVNNEAALAKLLQTLITRSAATQLQSNLEETWCENEWDVFVDEILGLARME